MSLGTILVIILIIFLLGGFSGRFGGYGYGFGHGGIGLVSSCSFSSYCFSWDGFDPRGAIANTSALRQRQFAASAPGASATEFRGTTFSTERVHPGSVPTAGLSYGS